MKRIPLFIGLILLVLLVVVGKASAAAPTISRISPEDGPNTGDVTVTITGTGFNAESSVFMHSCTTGSRIDATVVDWSPTSLTCRFSITGLDPAQYDVYVRSPFTDPLGNHYLENDGELPHGFEIFQGTGTTHATTTTTGTITPIPAPNPTLSYGSIRVSSTPSGATIYLDNEDKGLTTLTMNTVANGNHVVIIKRDGFRDWTQTVAVLGNSTSISATLIEKHPATTVTTMTVKIPKHTTVTKVQTTVITTKTPVPFVTTTPGPTRSPTSKAAVKIPTSWPTDPPPEPSPWGTEPVIIATMGAALLTKRK